MHPAASQFLGIVAASLKARVPALMFHASAGTRFGLDRVTIKRIARFETPQDKVPMLRQSQMANGKSVFNYSGMKTQSVWFYPFEMTRNCL
jgi:hypothetical protein